MMLLFTHPEVLKRDGDIKERSGAALKLDISITIRADFWMEPSAVKRKICISD
jgi:hypothetical protein